MQVRKKQQVQASNDILMGGIFGIVAILLFCVVSVVVEATIALL